MARPSADRWALVPVTSADFDELMTWFPDRAAVDIWGGPKFRYPFTRASFVEDLRIDAVDSYAMRSADNVLAAFGQSYERCGRGHLARLVTNPAMRRQGAGRQLIEMIIATLEERREYDEYSLFVYRHNVPALRCYLSLGFALTDYPEDAPMADKCHFLTRKSGSSDS